MCVHTPAVGVTDSVQSVCMGPFADVRSISPVLKVALSRFSWCQALHAQIFLLKITKNLTR